MNENKALVKVKENSLKEIGKRNLPKIVDGTKRVAKIMGWGTLTGIGMCFTLVGNLPLATIRRNCSNDITC